VTEQHGDRAALDAARNLTAALKDISADVRGLSSYGHRSRRMIWGIIVSLVLDLVLTVVVAVFAIQAHDANSYARAARAVAAVAQADNRDLCEAGNAARAQQLGLWTYLLSLAPAPGPQQQALRVKFRAHLSQVFQPRDCGTLAP
jgi:hypothetical protein